jgi:hypothetical protein
VSGAARSGNMRKAFAEPDDGRQGLVPRLVIEYFNDRPANKRVRQRFLVKLKILEQKVDKTVF